jgi:hypothetical protein
VRIDPKILFIRVAQDEHSGLWHGVLLTPDNSEQGFKHLSRFKDGAILAEYARDQASKKVPTIAVWMDGTFLYPNFDEEKAMEYQRLLTQRKIESDRAEKILTQAEERRERKRAKRKSESERTADSHV